MLSPLDVYKRQEDIRWDYRNTGLFHEPLPALPQLPIYRDRPQRTDTVSYTHLDVYKRQAVFRAAEPYRLLFFRA